MLLHKQLILKQLYHNILATICGCTLWYIVSEKVIITQTRDIPIYLYNTNNREDTFCFPATASVTLALSPGSAFTLSINDIGVHIDMSILSKDSTVLVEYQSAIVLPRGIKIVHCNPIIIHKVERTIVT
ncbi:MAG TPA: hypothetical protein VL201_03760 [Patescibacteria group bacterium]|jgi:hypothetical protein|nr:hypothetical protein [Patescibacteria group bacterium]